MAKVDEFNQYFLSVELWNEYSQLIKELGSNYSLAIKVARFKALSVLTALDSEKGNTEEMQKDALQVLRYFGGC